MAPLANSQALVEALPETGTVTYQELRDNLAAARKPQALAGFHKARRSGVIEARVIGGVLTVARPGQLAPREENAE